LSKSCAPCGAKEELIIIIIIIIIALSYGLGDREFESRQGLRIFLFTTQPPIQWVQGDLSLGVKRPGREADYSPPSSAEITNEWIYTSTSPILLHGFVFS
jgi:hypothetical protein